MNFRKHGISSVSYSGVSLDSREVWLFQMKMNVRKAKENPV
ncbi:hypothetical protein HOLDEFILI_00874 [Holdemania filiformis DSM 12042]|uniref:Uncharacterized protein n=1 Tax=Holdemania filiformis DSM 12042 TaxID=545696 RepID=B9Y4Z3_9FIRM|nr:hypothetical protein HOLDEFILI_00874 [Holdemania filiformis DSM 12042]